MSTAPAHVLKTYSLPLQERLMAVRRLIFSCAKQNPDIGKVEESLKWGQLSFATHRLNLAPKSGTPIRIGANEQASTYSLYVSCSTSLIANFRDTHPDMFEYLGSREIRLSLDDNFPETELGLFIEAALTYYL